jgi:hypothetical protein
MTTNRATSRLAVSRARLAFPAAALAAVLVVAGCGGSAGTPAPTAVPTISLATAAPTTAPTTAPTAGPTTAPTAAPTEALASDAPSDAPAASTPPKGTFLYGYGDTLDYYQNSLGYTCQDPAPSGVAKGYNLHMCSLAGDAGAPTSYIGFLIGPDGELGDIFAGVLNDAGGEMPAAVDIISPLAFILGTTLGETEGSAAAQWLAENLGTEMAKAEFNGNTVYTYTVNDESGVGAYSEVATPAYLAAPAP